jgi:hypothetical protein
MDGSVDSWVRAESVELPVDAELLIAGVNGRLWGDLAQVALRDFPPLNN